MCVLVTQSCPTLCNPMDCSPPGSSVHEIFQARILEWVAISFSRESSQPRDQTWVSCTAGKFFTNMFLLQLATVIIFYFLSGYWLWKLINMFYDCDCCSILKLCPTLRPQGLQDTRLPCPSPSPGICSNPCPLSQRCRPTISSSVAPFSSCPQSFPASGSFPMNWLFVSGSQSIGALASVLPINIQGWFPLGLTG